MNAAGDISHKANEGEARSKTLTSDIDALRFCAEACPLAPSCKAYAPVLAN